MWVGVPVVDSLDDEGGWLEEDYFLHGSVDSTLGRGCSSGYGVGRDDGTKDAGRWGRT